MRRALEMPLGERRARHRALWSRISDQDVGWWRERFLVRARQRRQAPERDPATVPPDRASPPGAAAHMRRNRGRATR